MTRHLVLLGALVGCIAVPPPPPPHVSIEPGAPADGDTLVLTVEPIPASGAPVSLAIRWFVDDVETLSGTTSITPNYTRAGERWRVEVVATVAGRDSAPGSDEVAIGETIEPPRPAGAGSGLCAASGTAASKRYSLTGCTSPVEAASLPMTSARFSLVPGPVEAISP